MVSKTKVKNPLESLTTDIWLLIGLIGSSQGIMSLEKGNLSLTLFGKGNLFSWHLKKLGKVVAREEIIRKLALLPF